MMSVYKLLYGTFRTQINMATSTCSISATVSLPCSITSSTATETMAAKTTITTAATTTTTDGDDDSFDDDDVDDCKDEIDPRVKVELETLNQSATDINRLEKEIDEARAKYQTTFSECSQQLEQLKKKFGGSIKRARPYYDLKESAREAQSEALRSARKFQTANGIYLAAKETISLAELRLMDDKAASLSAAWQEMLNHALARVMEAEKEKSSSEKEHLKRAAAFAEVENKMHLLEKKHKKSIAKARSYFETKKELEVKLQQVKQSVEDLQQAMQGAKQRYSGALKRLENISDGIHEKRRQSLILMFPREPGVGAEENENVSEREQKLPTLSSAGDFDGSACFYDDYDDDDVYYDESDEDDDGYTDIDNESVFRAKVLTTSLDDEDTSFMKLKGGARRRGKKPLKRTQSLPVYSGLRNKQKEEHFQQGPFSSEHCSLEEVFEKPLVPLSDRADSYPPDGDSMSSQKDIACDPDSSESNNDISDSNTHGLPNSSTHGLSDSNIQPQLDGMAEVQPEFDYTVKPSSGGTAQLRSDADELKLSGFPDNTHPQLNSSEPQLENYIQTQTDNTENLPPEDAAQPQSDDTPQPQANETSPLECNEAPSLDSTAYPESHNTTHSKLDDSTNSQQDNYDQTQSNNKSQPQSESDAQTLAGDDDLTESQTDSNTPTQSSSEQTDSDTTLFISRVDIQLSNGDESECHSLDTSESSTLSNAD